MAIVVSREYMNERTYIQFNQNILLYIDIYNHIVLLQAVGPDNTNTMEVYIGLTNEQFGRVFHVVRPYLIELFKDEDKSKVSLYIYLMKIRTNHTYPQMAPHFNISPQTVSLRVRQVREIVHSQFVPLHLFTTRRDEIIQHTTPISRALFRVKDDAIILILDGR